MARIFSSGAELNTTTAGVEWTTSDSGLSISSTTVRSGTYSLRSNPSSQLGSARYTFQPSTATGPFFFRAYIRIATSVSARARLITIRDKGANTTRGTIAIETDDTLTLWSDNLSTQIGSASSVLVKDTWYRVELKFDASPAGGSEELTARIDGTNFASDTSLTLSGNVDEVDWGIFTSTSGDIFLDDLAINDSTGSFQNSWAGEGEIIHLRPNGDYSGDSWDDWTGSSTDVDEVTPDDATTFISHNTGGEYEGVTLDSPTAIGTSDTINLVSMGVRFNGAGASENADFIPIIWDVSENSSTGSTIVPANTTWRTNAASVPRNYPNTIYDMPGVSTTAITKADLEDFFLSVNIENNNTNAAQVSTLWLLVDYTPAADSLTSDIKPKVGKVFDEKPQGLKVFSEKPKVLKMTGKTPRSQEVVIEENQLLLTVPLLTYKSTGTVTQWGGVTPAGG
jgi:hypothetical protein